MKLMSPPPQEMTHIPPHPPSVPPGAGVQVTISPAYCGIVARTAETARSPCTLPQKLCSAGPVLVMPHLTLQGRAPFSLEELRQGRTHTSVLRPGSPPEQAARPRPRPLSSHAQSGEAWSSGKFFHPCPCCDAKLTSRYSTFGILL